VTQSDIPPFQACTGNKDGTRPAGSDSDDKLIAILSIFLNTLPMGASIEYIQSYVQMKLPGVGEARILEVLSSYPRVFKQEIFVIGARNIILKKWQCIALSDN